MWDRPIAGLEEGISPGQEGMGGEGVARPVVPEGRLIQPTG